MADRVALGGGELRLVARILSLLLGNQPIMLGQRRLPALLQRARDQPVLRLDGVVLALRARDLIRRLLEPQGALPAPTRVRSISTSSASARLTSMADGWSP